MSRGYAPDFDIDVAYGEAAEDTVRAVLALDATEIEVKHKSRRDDKFYVEVAQQPGATGDFKPSGINNRYTAPYWAYVVADTGVIVLVPRDRLKAAARDALAVAETDGDNPTKGRLPSFGDLVR